jgi:hypothetical protein
MRRHILDAVISAIISAAIFFGLAFLPLPIMAIAYILPIILGGFNGILVVAVAIMLAVAAWWWRPGIALGPFLFAALWFAAAVTQRMVIAAREDPEAGGSRCPRISATSAH